jgi:hypothetical protein
MYHSRLTFALAMAALAAIFIPSTLSAQITFERACGGASDDGAYGATQTADRGYVITGWTCPPDTENVDVYLIKTDSLGDTLWTRTYGGPIDDWGYSVQQTTDGGYVITGLADNVNGVYADVYVIKTDSLGDTMWTRKYGGSDDDRGYSVQQTADGGYVVAGATYSFGQGYGNLYVLKLDVNGDTAWTRTYRGEDRAYGTSVQQTVDGGYIVAGATLDDVYLVKTNAGGDTMWTRTYGDAGSCYGKSVRQTADGGYIIAGSVRSSFQGYDVYLVKTDSLGDALWTRTFGGDSQDMGRSVWQTTDGGYVITGWTCSYGAGAGDVYLIKTDPNGDTQWSRTYGGADGDFGNAVQQTPDGGYIIAGETDSYGTGRSDVYLVKTDSLGNVAVAEPKTSPTRARALSLTCTPNPTTGTTTIHLTPFASRLSPFALRIYNAQGRRVRTFTVNRAPCTVWDGKDELGQHLPSGTYFVRLDAAGRHATSRLVVQQ